MFLFIWLSWEKGFISLPSSFFAFCLVLNFLLPWIWGVGKKIDIEERNLPVFFQFQEFSILFSVFQFEIMALEYKWTIYCLVLYVWGGEEDWLDHRTFVHFNGFLLHGVRNKKCTWHILWLIVFCLLFKEILEWRTYLGE